MTSKKKTMIPNFLREKKIVLVFVILLLVSIGYLLIAKQYFFIQNSTLSPTPSVSPTVSDSEKQQIDTWIKNNNLNQYGDSKDTMYTGGTPLFNETTGQTIDRYDYIVEKHQDKPWIK